MEFGINKKVRRKRIPVEKVDRDGNVIERYESIKEAADKNYLSRTGIISRCKNRVKKPFTVNGCTFRYGE